MPCFSTRVFETRTATGSELISLLTYPHTTTFTLLSIFSPLKISSRKIWETLRSKHAKCSLPVVVRVLKTRVPKLPKIIVIFRKQSTQSELLDVFYCGHVAYQIWAWFETFKVNVNRTNTVNFDAHWTSGAKKRRF